MTGTPSLVLLNPIGVADWGGVETDMLALAKGLPDRGFRVAAAGRRGGRFLGAMADLGLSTLGLSFRRDFGPVDAWRLRGFLRGRAADVILTKLDKGLRLAVLARAMGGRGAIVMQQGLYECRSGFRHRVLYRRLSRILVPARSIRERFRETGDFDVNRVDWVSNGVDSERFRPGTARNGAGPILVNTGRLHAQKDHARLVRILPRLPGSPTLVLAGRGPLEEDLRGRAGAAGVADRVRFPGHVEDVADLLAEADVFVTSSREEGMPNNVLEAMAAGLPIVATDVGDLRLMLDDGRAGLLVPPGDDEALAAALTRILSDPGLADRLGRAARERAVSEYPLSRRLDGAEECLRRAARRGDDRGK